MNISLIIGSCRSGTSILWDSLAIHPNVIHVWEEHDIWEDKYKNTHRFERLTEEQATADVVKNIRTFFNNKYKENKLIVAKNPMNLLRIPYVKKIFPDIKLIHIVRDGRDVACSLSAGINNVVGWHFQRPPNWKLLSIEERDTIMKCGKVWLETLKIGLKDLNKVDHYQLRFEDLINNSKEELHKVQSYLNLDISPLVDGFSKLISNDTSSGYQATWQDKWFTPHKKRVGRYKEDLDDGQIHCLNVLLKDMLLHFDYEIGE